MTKHLACSKMWTDINVNVPTKEIKNCCKREPQMLSPDEITSYGRNVFVKNRELLEDKKYFIENNDFPKTCSHCKHSHPASIWQNWNEWKDREWSPVALDSLMDSDFTRNVEIMLSTTCNQTCMYCTEQVSSEWAKLKGTIPIVDTAWKDATLQALYEYIECKLTFDFTPLTYNFLGGEPFLELETFDIMEKIISIHDKTWGKHSSRYIAFKFTSNLNVKKRTIEKFLEYVKAHPRYKFSVAFSLDALGTIGEEIRDGLDFSRFEENLRLLMTEPRLHRLDLLPTLSCLNVQHYHEVLQWFIDLAKEYKPVSEYGNTWQIGTNLVTWPFELMPALLPTHYSTYLDKAAEVMRQLPNSSYREQQINYLNRIKVHVIGKQRNKIKIDDAIRWFEEQGRLKNKNYWEIFPDLKNILNYENLNDREPTDGNS